MIKLLETLNEAISDVLNEANEKTLKKATQDILEDFIANKEKARSFYVIAYHIEKRSASPKIYRHLETLLGDLIDAECAIRLTGGDYLIKTNLQQKKLYGLFLHFINVNIDELFVLPITRPALYNNKEKSKTKWLLKNILV
jgi:hypothetical protein